MTTHTPSSSMQKRVLRWCFAVAVTLLTLLIIGALYFGQVIFIPLVLGIMFTFLLQPPVRVLQQMGLGRVPAVLVVVVLVSIIFGGAGWSVAMQLRGLVRELHTNEKYFQNLTAKLENVRGIGETGPMSELQSMLNRVNENLDTEPEGPAQAAVVVQAEPASQWETLTSSLAPLLAPLGTAALVLALTIFMLINREDLRNRLIGAFGHGRLTLTTRAIDDAGRRIGRYLLMQLIINGSYGIMLALILSLIGVPFALLWGLMAAVLRYIPYIGPWIGAAFPIMMSIVAFTGWTQPLMVIALIIVLELCSNMVMEPLLYGHSVGVSAVALIISAAFWTWLWGPIGLVLATPMTVCLAVLGQHVPQLRIFSVLLGDEPVLPPDARYYQRLVARDEQEAARLVQQSIERTGQICLAFDEVIVPALVRTRRDRYHHDLSAEDEDYILQATRNILAKLAEDEDSNAASEAAEGALAADGSGDASALGENVLTGSSSRSASPVLPVVVGCPAHHETEELVVRMLAQTLTIEGCSVSAVSTRALPAEIVKQIRHEEPRAVFIAVIPPSGLMQAGYLCRRLRKVFPKLPIVVAYWGNKRKFDDVLVRLRSRGAGFVTTSLCQSQKQILALLRRPPVKDDTFVPKVGSYHHAQDPAD